MERHTPPVPRSIRVDPDAWEAGKARAAKEGVTISEAAAHLVDGYSRGVYDLPTVTTTKTFPTRTPTPKE